MICAKCGKPLTADQISYRNTHCSLSCGARGNQNARRPLSGEIVALLSATRDQWLTLSDIAIWIYGDDLPFDNQATRMALTRMRRWGYRIERKRFYPPAYGKQWIHGYRLVGEPSSAERAA